MNHNLDLDFYENVIIYNALKNDHYLSVISPYIKPEYFQNKDIRNTFKVIIDFYTERNKIPTHTEIKSRLSSDELRQSFISVVSSFKNLDDSFDNDELINNTESFLKQKAIYSAVLSTADNLGSNDINAGEVLDKFDSACNISLYHDIGLDLTRDLQSFIDQLLTTTTYVSTGYQWLDNMLGGGFDRAGKALYLFAAPTNAGKSIMLTNIGCNIAAQNKRVVFVTLEMSEKMYAKRIASCLSKQNINTLESNTDMLSDDIIQFTDENPSSNILIKEFPTSSLTPSALTAYLKRLHDTAYWGYGASGNKLTPDAIIIDYLNLMIPNISTGSSYSDIKSITEKVRGMSYLWGGIPIVTATQLNRSADGEVNPGLDTTSESYGTSMTVDAQIHLWATEEDRELGILNVGMKKNRFGPNYGNKVFRIDWDNLVLTQADDVALESDELTSAHDIINDL